MAYIAPTSDDLTTRYPAFADVSADTIDYWLDDAALNLSEWPEALRARAEMAYAAHRLVETGAVSGAVPAGLTSFRSGDFAATVDGSVAARTGFDATVYGREFAQLRRRAFGGPFPAWTPPTADA